MLQCLYYCSFDMEPKIFISNLFENWDPYVHSNYKTISERYQGAEEYISYGRFPVPMISIQLQIIIQGVPTYIRFCAVFAQFLRLQTC